MTSWRVWLAALAMAACAPACGRAVARAPSEPRAVGEAKPERPELALVSALRTSLRAPAQIDYSPTSLGPSAPFVEIRVENHGPGPVPIPELFASFTAARDGVLFPCGGPVGRGASRELSRLGPGETFAFERRLDCTMPLPGQYEVSVWIAVAGAEGEKPPRAAVPLFAGSLPIEVTAREGQGPLPVPGRPGLYAMMTGPPVATPMAPEVWTKGGYELLVSLVNGGRDPVAVGPARLSLLVFRKGSALPCASRAQALDEPETLAPGTMHVTRVPVLCVPTSEGHYLITGRLDLGGGRELDIGRVALDVTGDPAMLSTPPDWRTWRYWQGMPPRTR
jgi:hypothetical protein